MKKIFYIQSIILFFLALFFLPSSIHAQEEYTYYRAIVEQIVSVEEVELEGIDEIQINKVLKLNIPENNEKVEIQIAGLKDFIKQDYKEGDRVLVSKSETTDTYSIVSYDRQNVLIILFAIFLTLAFIVSSKKTFGAILGLVFSFFVIFSFLIPQILNGASPVFISIVASAFIIPVSFYLSHGFNKKTSIAILSTIIALAITGFLALIFMQLSRITGEGSEEVMLINTFINSSIKIEGLLLAGVIIGTLGVLDDITISQAAIVEQIAEVGEKLSVKEVFVRAMKVGKDHMASMINTLVLVYTGASMPLLIIFVNADLPLNYILSIETVSMEIVRTLVGTIGLITAIPITTFLASLIFKKEIKESTHTLGL
jgi:uncharacterized membrane protein